MNPALIAIIVLLVVLLLVGFGMYNGLVRRRNGVGNGWSYIEVELKRRHDLIPNLVETVKGYAAHEQETFDRVVEARNAAMHASGGPAALSGPENALGRALQGLFALREAYPDLKASTAFLELQEELTATEDRIAVARRVYNANVRDYKNALQTVPQMWFARFGSFPPAEFFQAAEGDRAQPNVGDLLPNTSPGESEIPHGQ